MKFLAFSFLLLVSIPASSQKIWFQDTFDNYSKGWLYSDMDVPDMKRKIVGGKFMIEHKGPNIYWSIVNIWTDANKDYSFAANIVQQEGDGANGFGFVVLASGNKRLYFLINPVKGTFYVGTEENGKWVTLTAANNWEASPAIKAQKENNKLEIVRKKEEVSFLVNDQVVFKGSLTAGLEKMNLVNFYGLTSFSPMKFEVDDFTFLQDNTLNLVPNIPAGLKKVNLGPEVNSTLVEKTPVISHDGKTLFFSVHTDPATSKTGDDIFMSTSTSDTLWSPRIQMSPPLNNLWPNSVISVSPDNNTLILMHTYNPDGSAKGAGISMSNRTNEGWSVPTDVIISNFYNRSGTNEFCLSADRKVFLMSLQRDDTYGAKDIYISFLKENGEYTEPKNLGPVVNTFAEEATPFLAADGVSLYFATAGHPGYGSSDIFVTTRLDSTWTSWTVPQNLGPDINSSVWEAYYSIPASGRYAYVVSEKNSLGAIDIFRIKLPEALKPKPVVLVYGKVLNSETKEPLQARINYNLLSTNKELGIATSNVKDGSYKIILPADAVYSFLAMKDQFYSVSENIDLTGLKEYKEVERNLFLAPLKVGETIRLNNLFFDFNKSNLRTESAAELDRVVKLLSDNPTMVIEISGHTDNVGTDLYNNKLSLDRAAAVKSYLVGKGVATTRVQAKGYGKTKPTASNATESGRQQNRRVEFTILK